VVAAAKSRLIARAVAGLIMRDWHGGDAKWTRARAVFMIRSGVSH